MLVVNFKAYSQSSGRKASEIAEKCFKAGEKTGEKVIVTPQNTDLLRIDEGPVYGQHLDPVKPGSHTGHVTAESLIEAGCTGTLLNHSEKRIKPEKIETSILKAKEHSLETIVCAQTPEECGKLSEFKPDYIAYEPPELIGGDISVSEAKPELIEEAVKKSSVPVLTGAGIKNKEDVETAIELGCEGVLVASGVVKAENPEKAATNLCEGL